TLPARRELHRRDRRLPCRTRGGRRLRGRGRSRLPLVRPSTRATDGASRRAPSSALPAMIPMKHILAAVILLVYGAGPAAAQSRFDGWATAVISADWRDGHGLPIGAFDNARRDVAAGLVAAGLPRDSTIDLTLNPGATRT